MRETYVIGSAMSLGLRVFCVQEEKWLVYADGDQHYQWGLILQAIDFNW